MDVTGLLGSKNILNFWVEIEVMGIGLGLGLNRVKNMNLW
jgi:hypothetical protein